jgi:glucose/arabinose dehydrogenase
MRRHRPLRRLLSATLIASALPGCDGLRAMIINVYPSDYAPVAEGGEAQAQPPQRVQLKPRVTGLQQPTDAQFSPAHPGLVLIAEKAGSAQLFDLSGAEARPLGPLFALDVLTRSEQGLLGLAFAPDFGPAGGALYWNATRTCASPEGCTQVGRVAVRVEAGRWTAGPPEVLLEVPQPYANHNAGQIVFGPDGLLYVGLGDGGWREDPHGHGQDPATLLGSMLRIDPRRPDGGRAWSVPSDNPKIPGAPPETWAIGLRNPWRFGFAPDGRMVIADVGQYAWEELSIAKAGDNLGWAVREGRRCFPAEATCSAEGLVEPFYEYPHKDGDGSVTGGYVYTGSAIPALAGRYVFGDFLSGRLWSVPLPADSAGSAGPLVSAELLGKWAILPSTFARDPQGELYVADFGQGTLYQLTP